MVLRELTSTRYLIFNWVIWLYRHGMRRIPNLSILRYNFQFETSLISSMRLSIVKMRRSKALDQCLQNHQFLYGKRMMAENVVCRLHLLCQERKLPSQRLHRQMKTEFRIWRRVKHYLPSQSESLSHQREAFLIPFLLPRPLNRIEPPYHQSEAILILLLPSLFLKREGQGNLRE